MIERLIMISGGQTGADQGGLRAAKAAGVKTGGYAPKGWTTEEGPAPWLADFGLKEHESADYPPRTIANVKGAHATLWYGNPKSIGGRLTFQTLRRWELDGFVIVLNETAPEEVAAWMLEVIEFSSDGEIVFNVAGNRESKSPGIGALVEKHFGAVLALLKEKS